MDASVAYWVKQAIWLFILPPNGLITLAFLASVGAVVGRYRAGAGLAAICLAVFGLMMTPAVSQLMMQWVEKGVGPALTEQTAKQLLSGANPPEAIVILGGGQMSDAREQPHQQRLSSHTLMRVLHGARVARWTGLSVLVSGGRPDGSPVAEATIMARVLSEELGLKAQWVEDKSFDTVENARLSARQLSQVGIQKIILVTEAFHMHRARAAFERAGMQVVTAPHGFQSELGVPLRNTWLPGPESVERASLAIHEVVGRWWYQVMQWWQLIFPEKA
ncbi:MAG: YdcF family protein [Burkholderiaceae bacterium]